MMIITVVIRNTTFKIVGHLTIHRLFLFTNVNFKLKNTLKNVSYFTILYVNAVQ